MIVKCLCLHLLIMATQAITDDSTTQHRIAKRDACTSNIYFKHCKANKSKYNPMWSLSNVHKNYFKLMIDGQCLQQKLRFTWKLKKLSSGRLIKEFTKFNTKSILIIGKDILDIGEYSLEVKVQNKKTKSSKNLVCWIKVVTGEPVIILKGGSIRNVHHGDVLTLDASHTINAGIKNLKFNWKCEIGGANSKCGDLGSGNITTLKVNGNIGETYTVTLTVSSESVSKSVKQQIKIVDQTAPMIEIICEKNCLGKGHHESSPSMTLFLRAKCLKTCDNIDKYQWKITPDAGIDLSTAIEFGSNTEKFILPGGFLKRSTTYEIEVSTISNNKPTARAVWSIPILHNPAVGGKCNINPKSGGSIRTVFQIKCGGFQHSTPLSFAVQQVVKNSNAVFLAEGAIPEFDVRIASYRGIYDEVLEVLVTDSSMETGILEVQVQVKKFFRTSNQKLLMKEIIDVYMGRTNHVPSVKSLAAIGQTETATQVINCLLAEMKTIESPSSDTEYFMEYAKKKVLQDFLEFPTDGSLKGMLTLLPHCMDMNKPKSVELALVMSRICLKLSKQLEKVLKSVKYPLTEGKVANTYTSYLIDVGEYLLDGNFRKIQQVSLPTPPPLEQHPVIPEHYPDYDMFFDGSLTDQYKEITENAINTLKVSGHTYSMSLAYGEGSHSVGSTTQIIILSDTAESINKTISHSGVTATIPRHLGVKPNTEIRVLLTSFFKKSFFWDEKSKNISTWIVDLIIYVENEEVNRGLREDINLYLDAIENSTETMTEGSVTVPSDTAKWVKENLDFNMTVYRVEVKNGSNLVILFEDIKPAETIQVVVTKGRRPNLGDFDKAHIVRNKGSIVEQPSDYDTWYYIAVLPDKSTMNVKQKSLKSLLKRLYQMVTNTNEKFTLTYKYSFTTKMCLEWSSNNWGEANCKLGEKSTAEVVHCKCKSILLLAGIKHNQRSKNDEIMKINFKLKPVINYVVYGTTLFVLCSYFIALCFTVFRIRQKKKLVYFLGDNLKDSRYAYFIVIKNGKQNKSGTTSNITIKLFASKTNSRAHVLNYPDPDKMILQQGNEDWFILTTSTHLGEIRHIELWFDSIGCRPFWYCDNINIYDLQTNASWFINVREWFTVLEDGKQHYTIAPSDKARRIIMNKSLIEEYFRMYFGADHTWNIFLSSDDHNFTYVERITVILSHILCTYSFVLLISTKPEMRMRDVLDKSHFNSYYHIMKIAIGTSIISFFINISFTILFMYSQRSSKLIMADEKKLFSPRIIRITWILLIATITTNAIYVITFGFGISQMASFVWLVITTVAILFSIFVWENIYLSISFILKLILYKRYKFLVTYNFSEIIRETESQRRMLYGRLGIYALRPYLTHLYKPLHEAIITEKRRKLRTKIEIARSFKDMVAFIMYIFFFYMLLLANLDSMTATHNDHMEDMISGGKFVGEDTLADVQNIDEIYQYLNNTLLPTIHSYNWYGNWSTIDPGLMADFHTKVLGVVRIRQKRVVKNCCRKNIIMNAMNIEECNPVYSPSCEDRTSKGNNKSVWFYHSSKPFSVLGTYGEMTSYSDGGYIVYLGRNLKNAYYMLQLIKENHWIDLRTRALFIEFWTYNANRNIFNSVKIIIERSPTQLIMTSTEVLTGLLLYGDVRIELLTIILFSIYVIIIISQIIKYAIRVFYQGAKFFRHFWNILDIVILMINISTIILFIIKMELVEDLIDELENTNHNEFVNYYVVFYFTNTIIVILAVLICIATLRLWKFLRFGLMFRVFERTLRTASQHLLGVFIYNLVACTMYSFAGYIFFGSFSRDYRNLDTTFTSLMMLFFNINKKFDYNILEDYNPGIGVVYYSSYMLVMLTVLNVYVTVIIIHYENSRIYFSNLRRSYSIKDYFLDEWKYLSELYKRKLKIIRLRAGQDTYKVYPKADEHRYADCVLMSNLKMERMATMASGVVHNSFLRKSKSEIELDDYKVMDNIVRNLALKTPRYDKNKTIFFKGNSPDGKVAFVADHKMLQMEYLVKRILAPPKADVVENEEILPIKDVLSLKRIENVAIALNYTKELIGNINVVLERKKKTHTRKNN